MEGTLNTSGIEPRGTNCLVKMKLLTNNTATGLVTCTEAELERRQMGQTVGQLVAKGENAHFDYNDAPMPGDHVFVKKYSGTHIVGADGEAYRLCVDVEVPAVITQPEKIGAVI